MAIISIAGKINSGKDTVGKIIQYLTDATNIKSLSFIEWCIVNEYSNHHMWKIRKFAGKLKQMVSLLTGIPVKDMEKQEVKDMVLGEEWWYYQCVHSISPFEKISCNGGKPESKDDAFKRRADLSRIHSVPDTDYRVDIVKPTVRWLLQNMGTEAVRNNIHPNAWVNALFADYKKPELGTLTINPNTWDEHDVIQTGSYPNWIITDMRFPNEYEAVKARNGVTIRVTRSLQLRDPEQLVAQIVGQKRPLGSNLYRDATKDLHPAETALDNHTFDYEIVNNGTIEELISSVRSILQQNNLI